MEELLNYAETCLHVVLAVVFFVTPGMVFWLVVAGLVAAVQRFTHSNLYLTVRNRFWAAESLSS
jgi:hypothetical protein